MSISLTSQRQQPDVEDLAPITDELSNDELSLVAGGMFRRTVYVDVCYDDDGNVTDVTYIDIP